MPRKYKTAGEFIERCKTIHPRFLYDKTEYVRFDQPIVVTCPTHGDLEVVPWQFLESKFGCRECWKEYNRMPLRRSPDYLKSKLHNVFGDIYNYDNIKILEDGFVTIECKEHGPFTKRLVNLYAGFGCPECTSPKSKVENIVHEWFPNFIKHDRTTIKPQELDLVDHNKKIAVEVNGMYWHTEQFVDKFYHLNKTKKAADAGYQVLHFTDVEVKNKPDIVKSMIASKLGLTRRVYARKCQLVQIDHATAKQFVNENHIQGSCQSSVNLALVQDGIVAVMTFGPSRFNKRYQWELLRYCSRRDITVVGGGSRLLQHFIKQHSPESIVSYANSRYSNGNFYKALGFDFVAQADPNYVWVGKDVRTRYECQKHKLGSCLPGFREDWTEVQNMQNAGYWRMYDCGNSVWEMRFQKPAEMVIDEFFK